MVQSENTLLLALLLLTYKWKLPRLKYRSSLPPDNIRSCPNTHEYSPSCAVSLSRWGKGSGRHDRLRWTELCLQFLSMHQIRVRELHGLLKKSLWIKENSQVYLTDKEMLTGHVIWTCTCWSDRSGKSSRSFWLWWKLNLT